MYRSAVAVSLVLGAAGAGLPAFAAPQDVVRHTAQTIDGIAVDTYSWFDSKNLLRSVSLKREGGGNPAHGGYAIRMTFQRIIDGRKPTITASADDSGDTGFGYFVSHERYRDFADGDNDTIAHKIFGADDSPLGKGFPVVGTSRLGPKSASASHTFTLSYPRYGTIAPIPRDENGNEVQKAPTTAAAYKKYTLAVSMTWTFQARTDYPRVDTVVNMSNVGGPDRVSFDVRAPYGVLDFDPGPDTAVSDIWWGDRYHFTASASPVTRATPWVWNRANEGKRYHAIAAGGVEMGLYEPVPYASSATPDGYSDARGHTSATYNDGNGCPDTAGQVLPCDYEWPYQSLQYSLSYDNPDAPTTGKKLAWGSAPFFGAGPTLPRVYDSGSTYKDFVGFPATRRFKYSTCVVLGTTTAPGLTRTVAGTAAGRCATAVVR